MNGQGEVTAKSTLLNIKLNDVLEIKKNRYLVVGTRADTPGGTHRPFVAVYEAIPGAGPAGFFQPLTALSPGLGDEKSDPVSIVRMSPQMSISLRSTGISIPLGPYNCSV